MKLTDVTKEYKIKGGGAVKALDGISFELPERGMVFLLGKSGSGKTTLLNLMSGLDTLDGGEIEYRGRNLGNFTPSEMDSFRNTCCGFVFQDYNLIPELTVGENIALALQLQGDRDTNAKVEKALKDVELEGYKNRRIYELSGGQKQRIAIARALVKNPEIIFADEPTGALDSATGRTILELLKEISKKKLVVVVTHDRESAEKYADRIIELADGRVIGDTLTEQNIEQIKATTIEWKKPKMPLKAAVKIGCSNFKHHPIRLICTILLAVIAFTFLGISLAIYSTDFDDLVLRAMDKNGVTYTQLRKSSSSYSPLIKEEERKAAGEKTGISPLGVVEYYPTIDGLDGADMVYYSALPDKVVEADGESLKALGLTYVGNLPAADGEIAVTEYLAEMFSVFGIIDDGDICGIQINVDGKPYTITAVVDTHFDGEKYSSLKDVSQDAESSLVTMFYGDMVSSLHSALFFSDISDYYDDGVINTNRNLMVTAFGAPITVRTISKVKSADKIFSFDGTRDGNFLPAGLIPTMLGSMSCNIDYGNKKVTTYGQLFGILLEERYGEENVGGDKYIEIYREMLGQYDIPTIFEFTMFSRDGELSYKFNVDGFFYRENADSLVVLGNSDYSELYEVLGGRYSSIIIPVNRANINNYLGGDGLEIYNFVAINLERIHEDISNLSKAFGIISVVFLVMAVMLLSYFVSQSLMDKMQTIGVLKAFGCNALNLVKIFVWEGLIVGGMVIVLSLPIVAISCAIINGVVNAQAVAGVAIFMLNLFTAAALVIITLALSLLSCIIPILRLSRFKPTDFAQLDI